MSKNVMKKFIKSYQSSNPEKFNLDLINSKSKDNIVQLIADNCKTLEILDGIKFIGCYSREFSYPKIKSSKERPIELDLDESRLFEIVINFKLKKGEEECNIEKILYFPILLENTYFLINGNKYYPVWQLVDSETYRTKAGVVQKTMIMPNKFANEKSSLVDYYERINISTRTIIHEIFKQKLSPFAYFFAKMGVSETLKYFDINDKVSFINENQCSEDDDFYIFKISKDTFLKVDKYWFDEDINNRSILISTLLSTFKKRIIFSKIYENEYWMRQLGSNFTKNNSNHLEKAQSILSSLERILDNSTKRFLRIPASDKENIYAVNRWIILNYYNLLKQDNMDLANKRLRLYEYLMYPLSAKFSKAASRILNSKNVTLSTLKTVFSNIDKGFLIKEIMNNSLIRYMNAVNTAADLPTKLKGSTAGPQSQSESGGASIKSKTLHESMLGRIDICATSSGDPGTSFSICPFCKITNTFNFTEKPNLDVNLDDEEDDE